MRNRMDTSSNEAEGPLELQTRQITRNIVSFVDNFSGDVSKVHATVKDAVSEALRASGQEPTDSQLSIEFFRALGYQLPNIAALAPKITALSRDYQFAVLLADGCRKSNEEVANILGVPTGTVKSRLHRARMQLLNMQLPGDAG